MRSDKKRLFLPEEIREENRDDVETAEQHVQHRRSMRQLLQLTVLEFFTETPGVVQAEQREKTVPGDIDRDVADDDKRHVDQQAIEIVRVAFTEKDRERQDARRSVVVHVARVVAVQNGFGVQSQRECVEHRVEIVMARLSDVRVENSNRSKGEQNENVAEGDVLEA